MAHYRHAVRRKPSLSVIYIITRATLRHDGRWEYCSGSAGILFFLQCTWGDKSINTDSCRGMNILVFLLLLLRIGGSGVWQSQAWMCHEFRGLPRLRCPCSRPPRPTRSPETTPGWMSPAPPVPAGSECPFWLWLRTGTTGWRSVQEQTAGVTVECWDHREPCAW